MEPQLRLQQLVNVPHPVRVANDINVVEERKQLLVLLQLLRNGHQRTMLSQAEQHRHRSVAGFKRARHEVFVFFVW